MKGLSVFFPAFNDEMTIEKLTLDTMSVLDPLHLDYEITIIEDGSSDNTLRVAKRLSERYQKVRVLEHKTNKGYGEVIKDGFAHASKEWVFYTDGDGQYNVKEITKLLPYAGEFDLINGYILRRNDPIGRILLSKTYHFCLKILFGETLNYVNCDFRLIRKSAVKDLDLFFKSGFAPAEMITKLMRKGVRVKEVPVSHFSRKYGRSQFLSLKQCGLLFYDLLKIFFRRDRKTRNLKRDQVLKKRQVNEKTYR